MPCVASFPCARLQGRGGIKSYEKLRGYADGRGTSRLSPYLRFGLLSPRALWSRLREAQAKVVAKTLHRWVALCGLLLSWGVRGMHVVRTCVHAGLRARMLWALAGSGWPPDQRRQLRTARRDT